MFTTTHRLVFVLALALFSTVATAEDLIEAPRVMLQGIAADISTADPASENVVIKLNGNAVARGAGLIQTTTGTALLEVFENGNVVMQREIPVIPAWVSLLPPLIAIVLAFALRSVVPSLFIGLVVGAWAINGMTWSGGVNGLFDALTVYILNAVIDPDHGAIILFSLMIGGMVGIVSRNGGMVGIVNRVIPIARTPRRGQAVIAFLGLTIFFDDYSNTMIVGNATRPVSDRLWISREKLAYLVDSTAAPVATVAVVTTWVGFQVGLIDDAIQNLEGLTQPAYGLFLQSIPYSFYPFLAILLVFLVVLTGKDFGPMYRAELRARSTGQVSRHHTDADEADGMGDFRHRQGIPCRAVNGIVPILFLIGGVVCGIYLSGEGDSLQAIVSSADAYVVLIWASLMSCVSAAVLTLAQRLLTLEEIVDAWTVGAKFMFTGLILLVLAWAIADVARILQAAPYLISILGDSLAPELLPGLVFLLAAAAGFATGSSWGVMAILMPLVLPLSWTVLANNTMDNAEHMHIIYSCIASVLCGSVWADHCSPISDTTVLSSLASGCDHLDHVTTQIPYALLGGGASLLLCTLPAGFGVAWWMLLLVSGAVVFSVHRVLGKRAS